MFQKGYTPWNKGKSLSTEQKKKISLGVKNNLPKTAFKKGHSPWSKGIPIKEKVSYSGIHYWIRDHYPKPKSCEHCGKTGISGKKFNWANKSGKYLRDFSDWIALCVPCHRKYDKRS